MHRSVWAPPTPINITLILFSVSGGQTVSALTCLKATNNCLRPSFISRLIVVICLDSCSSRAAEIVFVFGCLDKASSLTALICKRLCTIRSSNNILTSRDFSSPSRHLLLPEGISLSFWGQWTGKANSKGREITLILYLTLTEVVSLSLFFFFFIPSHSNSFFSVFTIWRSCQERARLWPRCQGHRWELGKVDLFQTIIEITLIS